MSRATLFAVQHIRKLTGKTQAHLMRASDGYLYITKFSNNPLGIRVLASEFLATKIGHFLGLPMPEVALIEVPDLLIESTPGLQMEMQDQAIVRCAQGTHLAVRYAGDVWKDRIFDHVPATMFHRVSNPTDFLRILPFDKWLGNCDHRQAVFVGRSGQRKYRAIFIDQHDCFDGPRWQFLDKPEYGLYGGKHVYEAVTGWRSFEPALSRIENISADDLRQLASEVPAEWYGSDQNALSSLIETLSNRREIVCNLIADSRRCSRSAFPHWR